MSLYTSDYFDAISAGSCASAEVIVPMVMELVAPKSVVDVGCGIGVWLEVFERHGVARVCGIDGAYVELDRLRIDRRSFVAADLSVLSTSRENGGWPALGRFDLAVCLEVAEHIEPGASEALVHRLCALSDVVMFSAATPYQGGEGHINERWPSFWYELFEARGHRLIDVIRSRVWSDRRVEPWYQQNVVIYASERAIEASARVREARAQTRPEQLSMVHPRIFGLLLEREGIKPAGPWQPGHAGMRAGRDRPARAGQGGGLA